MSDEAQTPQGETSRQGKQRGTPMIQIGALWLSKRQTRNGSPFWTGKINSRTQYVMFENGRKTSDKSPDFLLYLSELAIPDYEAMKKRSADWKEKQKGVVDDSGGADWGAFDQQSSETPTPF